MRPCEEHKPCKYETFDYSEDCVCCGIDFDGDNCPYIKPWGKQKYRRDHEPPKGQVMGYCKNCKRWTCGAQGTSHEMAIPCGNYISPTNADRIRAMTDEELADCLLHICDWNWLDWLKSPIEDIDE